MIKRQSELINYWNKRGKTYNRSWQSFAKKNLSKMETGLIDSAINNLKIKSPKKCVKSLDIGIGTGRIAGEILKFDVEFYGTDISSTMIKHCKKRFGKNKKLKKLEVHDILNPLPKGWNNFDLVTAYRVLSYNPIQKLPTQLRNIYRVMNKGGILIFTFPNKYSSMVISDMVNKANRLGYETDIANLKRIIKAASFTEYEIVGFSRLLDTFYDLSNSVFPSYILISIEKFFKKILGPTFFVRLFYITCKK